MYVLHLSQWRNYVARRPYNGGTSDGAYSKPMKEKHFMPFWHLNTVYKIG